MVSKWFLGASEVFLRHDNAKVLPFTQTSPPWRGAAPLLLIAEGQAVPHGAVPPQHTGHTSLDPKRRGEVRQFWCGITFF